jgi:hypothetical protein
MNAGYIQGIRNQLERRVTRLRLMKQGTFHYALLQFFDFLNNHPVLRGIVDVLEKTYPDLERTAAEVVEAGMGGPEGQIGNYLEPYERRHAAFSYFLIKECCSTGDYTIEVRIIHLYIKHAVDQHDKKDRFFSIFIEPLYIYLDEALDDERAMLSHLRRYKHKCEWFARDQLYKTWEADTRRGEKHLAKHLYEYLYDQGVDFHIEPASASGEIDLLGDQVGDDRLAADAKIFNPAKKKGKAYIAQGFNQLYKYLLDYNEAVGYLVIFNTSNKDLALALSVRQASAPYLLLNHKTIYLVVVNISPKTVSASKSGRVDSVQITDEDLIPVTVSKKRDGKK